MRRAGTLGISQLELLISLAIMGMIAVLAANAFSFAQKSEKNARSLSDEIQMMVNRETMKNRIEQIPIGASGDTDAYRFTGGHQTLQFKSRVKDNSFWVGALTDFQLALIDRNLVLTGQGIHPNGKEAHSASRKLAADVIDLKITYYGRPSTENVEKWHRKWSDNTSLPTLVKLEWQTKNQQVSPPLTMVPGKADRKKFMSLFSLVPAE